MSIPKLKIKLPKLPKGLSGTGLNPTTTMSMPQGVNPVIPTTMSMPQGVNPVSPTTMSMPQGLGKQKGFSFANFKGFGKQKGLNPAAIGGFAGPGTTIKIYIAGLKILKEIFITFVILGGFGLLFVALYYIIYVSYPRPFKVGHTEPLEEFMKEYLADLLNSIQYCARNPDKLIDANLSKDCANILRAMCTPIRDRPDFYLLGGSRNLSKEPFRYKPEDCTQQELPTLYIYFSFYEAIKGDASASTLDEIRDLIAVDIPYAPGLTSAVTRKKSLSAVKKDLDTIHAFFQKVRVPRVIPKLNLKKNTPPPPSIYDIGSIHLSVLVSYRAQIWHMYDFRKDKQFLGIFWALIYDLNEYIFKEVLKNIWITIGTDISNEATAMSLWFTSEPVRKFVMSIPFRIAGIDPYENAPDALPPPPSPSFIETFAPFTKPGDTVETIGFLKGLIELPKAFLLLPQFLGTIIKFFKILTKPFAIFRLVIGLIFGITILIFYIILSVIATIVFIIPATIKVIFFKILTSIIYIIIYIFAFVIYFVISGINSLVGGSLTGLLRCEDLPSAWLKYTNYMFGNKHVRRLFCNGTCRSKFLTTANWCNVTNRPSQCPQQVIYKLFYDSFWRNNPKPKAKEDNATFGFKPDLNYMSLKSDEREKIIREHLREKYQYLQDCYKNSTHWSKLTNSSTRYRRRQTHPINKDIFLQSSVSVCDFIKKHPSKIPPAVKEELEYLCNETYCNKEYKPIYRSKNNTEYEIKLEGKPLYSFCKDSKESDLTKDYDKLQKSQVSAFNGFITVSFGCILIGILFAVFVHVKPGNSYLNAGNVE